MKRKMRKRLRDMEARLARLEKPRTGGVQSTINIPGAEQVGRYEFPGTADQDTVAREMAEAIRRVVMRHGGMPIDEDGKSKGKSHDEKMAAKFGGYIKHLSPKDRAKLRERLDLLNKAIEEGDG